MRNALGLYTLSLEAEDEDMCRIYGNDLLLLARLYIDSDEMSARSYYFKWGESLTLRDNYSEVVSQLIKKQEKNKSENWIRGGPSKFAKFIRSKAFKYVTYGFFSTGQLRTAQELNVWNDQRNVREYAEKYNSYDGSLLFEGNSGFKENVIGNLRDRYLPTAQSKKTDLVVYYGGHGLEGTGEWLIVENGSVVKPFTNNSQKYKIRRNENATVTFEDFMSSVENFNSKFSPRVTVHIVLFSCYSGHWIEKLRVARERNPGAYPDIGVILTAADKDHGCNDFFFAEAFWGKVFGENDANITNALNPKPLKYISAFNSSVSYMEDKDFKYNWFKDGNDWKVNTSHFSDSFADISVSSNTCLNKDLNSAWGILHNSTLITDEFHLALESLDKAEDLLDCDEAAIDCLSNSFRTKLNYNCEFHTGYIKIKFKEFVRSAKRNILI